jgi:hypothetical protein
MPEFGEETRLRNIFAFFRGRGEISDGRDFSTYIAFVEGGNWKLGIG